MDDVLDEDGGSDAGPAMPPWWAQRSYATEFGLSRHMVARAVQEHQLKLTKVGRRWVILRREGLRFAKRLELIDG